MTSNKENRLPQYLLIFILLNGWVIAQTWNLMPSPTRQNLARLDMLSDSLGFTVSYDGMILKYNGDSWINYDSITTIQQYYKSLSDSLTKSVAEIGDIYTLRVPDKKNGWLAINHVEKSIYSLFNFNPLSQSYKLNQLPIKIRALAVSYTHLTLPTNREV